MAMFPYITLPDETLITHSHLLEKNGVKTVKVHFERPKPFGFDSATCLLPSYEWILRDGYSDEEIAEFERMLQDGAHIFFKYAELGGIQIASEVNMESDILMDEPALMLLSPDYFRDPETITELSQLCESSETPVCISGNGIKDIVVMTREAYEDDAWNDYLIASLAEAEAEEAAGAKPIPADDVIRRLREIAANAQCETSSEGEIPMAIPEPSHQERK